VNGVKYKVKVIDGGAVEEDRNGRKLLRIRITAEVGGVKSEYAITYGRMGLTMRLGDAPTPGPTPPAAGRQTRRGSRRCVKSEYAITYGRYGADNAARGRTYARADAPGGREADAERLSALVKALTGKRPRVYRMKNSEIMIECYEGHLDGFKRYAELADAVEKWLEETSR